MHSPVKISIAAAGQGLAPIPLGVLDIAAAMIALQVKLSMPRMVRGQLLWAWPAILFQRLRLLPPPELRKVQGVIFGQETSLNLFRPGFKAFGEVGIGHTRLPRRGQSSLLPSGSGSSSQIHSAVGFQQTPHTLTRAIRSPPARTTAGSGEW